MTAGNLDPSPLAAQEDVGVSYVVRVLRIAFLAPACSGGRVTGKVRQSERPSRRPGDPAPATGNALAGVAVTRHCRPSSIAALLAPIELFPL